MMLTWIMNSQMRCAINLYFNFISNFWE